MRISVMILVFSATLSGCSETQNVPPPQAVVGPPEARIAISLEKLENQVGKLARIQKAKRKVKIDEIIFAPTELLRTIAYYEYTGHVSRIVQDVADQSGYKFALVGRPPNIPIIISIKWTNITLIDALKDAGARAAYRANIFVDAENKKIEVRYDS